MADVGNIAGIQAEVIGTTADSRGRLAGTQAEVVGTATDSRGRLYAVWVEVVTRYSAGAGAAGTIMGEPLRVRSAIQGQSLGRRRGQM